VGAEVKIENLTKRFGSQTIFDDVSLTIPEGEISVMLGPSGTGKSVFLKHLVGLLRPTNGHIWIHGKDVCSVPESELYEIRKLFGVLFQDGALFGSQNLYDNIAFPLREHTKKSESEIKKIVLEKLDIVGLTGTEDKLPGEISGGMKKRAGLARALVLNPEILLFDEPDSGLDPVRVAYLDQLVVDINAQTGATCLTVTHNIGTARTVPDNIGLLYQKHLAMFGPRQQLLTSPEPVVLQFMNGRKQGPIGMSEEKDTGEQEREKGEGGPDAELPSIEPQLLPSWPLVRRSMASPHGSHAFLKEPGMREKIKVNAKFGEDGVEPSKEAPAQPMSPDDFLAYLEEGGDKESRGESGDDTASTQASSSQGGSGPRPFPVPAGDESRRGVGPAATVGGAATAATAAVAMHKARGRDTDGRPDDGTRPIPGEGSRPKPNGRPRPTPAPTAVSASSAPQPAHSAPQPTHSGPQPGPSYPSPQPGPGYPAPQPGPGPAYQGPRPGSGPTPQAPQPTATSAPTATYQRPSPVGDGQGDAQGYGDGQGDGDANGRGAGNERAEPAGSRRGMLASLLRRGDR